MLIRCCSGHPFFDPPVSPLSFSYHLVFFLSFLFSLPLPLSLSFRLVLFFLVYTPLSVRVYTFPRRAASVSHAESLLFSDTKHAILVHVYNRHYHHHRRRRCLFAVVIVCSVLGTARAAETSMSDKRPFIASTMLLLISIARVIFSLTPASAIASVRA